MPQIDQKQAKAQAADLLFEGVMVDLGGVAGLCKEIDAMSGGGSLGVEAQAVFQSATALRAKIQALIGTYDVTG